MSITNRVLNASRLQDLINKKGTICSNCHINCEQQIVFHHIIPLSLGGTDNDSNIVPLCTQCHQKIHGITTEKAELSHSELTKLGMERARQAGKQIGGKKGSHYITKKSIIAKEIIKKECKDFNGNHTDAETMILANISKKTYYKYKKELREEI